MNPYLVAVLAILLAEYALSAWADWLDARGLKTELPGEFQGIYDPARYSQSQRYLRDHTRLRLVQDSLMTTLAIGFILAGGFGRLDRLARSVCPGELGAGLLFAALLLWAWHLAHIPFSAYATFVIEERYAFNKTTPRTFALDVLKGWLLAAALGAPLFAGILWFFSRLGAVAWLYCWGAVTLVQLLLALAAPVLIMPLFNKFTPLAAGELRSAIEAYARSQGFAMQGIFVMDGSRRSGKSNAFFTGLGRFRRVVLLDTLIARHTVPELLAVLAHEMGHFKERHLLKSMFLQIGVTGSELFLLSFFIGNERLAQAFGLQQPRVYAGLFFFGFLFAPISLALSVAAHALSRRWEFAADAYARRTADAEAFISALKRLSVDNLSNLTPHPFKVLLAYSHPPVLQRLQALRRGSD
ncbi:MAG: M48 family metallopeptidase [Elusimicrobia bacterium]|nr:M48 family metallopeptidase [Elusimicrobiota bacterium]